MEFPFHIVNNTKDSESHLRTSKEALPEFAKKENRLQSSNNLTDRIENQDHPTS